MRAGARGALFVLTAVTVAAVNFSVALSSIAMAGAAALFLAGIVLDRPTFLRPTGLEWAFALYVGAELLASAFGVDPADSFMNARRVLQISVVYLTAASFDTLPRIRAGILLLAASCAVASLIEVPTVALFGGTQERATLFQLSITEGSIKLISFLLPAALLAAGEGPLTWRIMAGLSAAGSLLGVILTFQRSAWVAAGAAATVMGLYFRKLLIAIALFAVLFVALAPRQYFDRVLSIGDMTDVSIRSRFQMYDAGWRMFLDRPLTGWGDTGLLPWYVTYITPLWEGEGGHLHNNMLTLLVTLGIPGFCAGIWLFWRILRTHLKAAGSKAAPWRAVGVGTLSAYAGFHVIGIFEYNFGDHEVAVLLWFITGLAVSVVRNGAQAGSPAASGSVVPAAGLANAGPGA